MALDRMKLQNMCKKEHESFKEYAQSAISVYLDSKYEGGFTKIFHLKILW